jgi:gas vesicle protein
MKKTTKKIAAGAVIAGVGGYLAGILTAPKSGKETRKDIKDAAVATTAEAERRLKELHTELSSLLDKAKTKSSELSGKTKIELDKLVGNGTVAKQKAREILSAIHEGDAEDKDLKKAVNETTAAVEHLKSYLKK